MHSEMRTPPASVGPTHPQMEVTRATSYLYARRKRQREKGWRTLIGISICSDF